MQQATLRCTSRLTVCSSQEACLVFSCRPVSFALDKAREPSGGHLQRKLTSGRDWINSSCLYKPFRESAMKNKTGAIIHHPGAAPCTLQPGLLPASHPLLHRTVSDGVTWGQGQGMCCVIGQRGGQNPEWLPWSEWQRWAPWWKC